MRVVVPTRRGHYRVIAMQQASIKSFRGPHFFLSNFYPCNVEIDGKIYPTTEHYYQSMKSTIADVQDAIASAPDAKTAKKLGRNIVIRPDWEQVKDEVMLKALHAKFSVPELSEHLLGTGFANIEESNSWNDLYWGIDSDTGKGKNKLGKMLMMIRDELWKKSRVANEIA